MRRVLLGVLGVLAVALFATPAQAQIETEFGVCHAVPVPADQPTDHFNLILPNMQGVVNGHDNHPKDIVLTEEGQACPAGDGDGGGGGGGEEGGPPAATSQPSDSLALTGFDAFIVGLIGLAMAAAGLGVRRMTRA